MKSIFRLVGSLVIVALAGLPAAQAADGAATPRIIKIRSGVDNAMKFDLVKLAAAPGETIKVMLTNHMTLPKEVMGHNWVLLTAGSDPVAFAAAAAPEASSGYIPSKLKDKVVASIAVLGPNETGEVTFTVPTAPGEYPFLCSFPGHCLSGMKGVLVVKK